MIDAPAEFNVSVDASCFSAQFDCAPSMFCEIKDFYTNKLIREYGWVDNCFVSDTKQYSRYSCFDAYSAYIWRSGIKHDCSLVLELTRIDGEYVNGFGDAVQIEDDLIYPLLKSSDINNYKANQYRKFLIVPQHNVGEDTSRLEHTHPLAYSYLMKYKDVFVKRKSSIYKGKGVFSIFGVGDYSFKPYKIVVSSLYKTLKFVLISPFQGKPIMVDDTCYQLDFDNIEETTCVYNAICSEEIQSLLKSLVFVDAKEW